MICQHGDTDFFVWIWIPIWLEGIDFSMWHVGFVNCFSHSRFCIFESEMLENFICIFWGSKFENFSFSFSNIRKIPLQFSNVWKLFILVFEYSKKFNPKTSKKFFFEVSSAQAWPLDCSFYLDQLALKTITLTFVPQSIQWHIKTSNNLLLYFNNSTISFNHCNCSILLFKSLIIK